MYYVLAFVAFLFFSFGIFLMLSKKKKVTMGVICLTIGICTFISIPIIAIHSFLFSPTKTEAKQDDKPVDIDFHASIAKSVKGDVDVQLLEQILKSFTHRCSPILKKYPNCIESATATIRQYDPNDKYPMYRQEDYSWFTEIEIQIKMKDNPAVLANDYLLSGHTMTFFLGAGTEPGVEADKGESATFIGVPKDKIIRGQKIFVPVADYKVIDQLIKN